MKKFSNISGYKVKDPEIKDVKMNEEDIFKLKVLDLMDKFLSIRTYGPIDRYQRAGSIKIVGKEMFIEALMELLKNKSLREQINLLESLKFDIKDWDIIDSKIGYFNKEISKNEKITELLTHKNKLNNLYKNYKDDETMLIKMAQLMAEKITNAETAHLRAISAELMSNSGKYPKEIFKKISQKFHNRAKELGYSK